MLNRELFIHLFFLSLSYFGIYLMYCLSRDPFIFVGHTLFIISAFIVALYTICAEGKSRGYNKRGRECFFHRP